MVWKQDQQDPDLDPEVSRHWLPERALLLGVLKRAIYDYVSTHDKWVKDAEEWIFGDLNTPTNEVFTFPWVCEQLGIDYLQTAEVIEHMPKGKRLLLTGVEA